MIAGAMSLALSSFAHARDNIKIVGSSTVYPYAQAVAEEFAKSTGQPSPVLESTGTGGGMKLFCKGIGKEYPDITNASRAMKPSERKRCEKNNIGPISEILIGYDGISIATSKDAPDFNVSIAELYLVLAKEIYNPIKGEWVPNFVTNWRQLKDSFPDLPIRVYGPPPTSGTRDAFVDLVMHVGCKQMLNVQRVKKELDKKAFKAYIKNHCSAIRQDGAYIEAGENDNLIVQRLQADKQAFGIFGYSFLYENQDKLKAVRIDGAKPSLDAIASGDYPISRPLYFYVKDRHRKFVKGLNSFVQAFVSEDAFGEDGYLVDRGLVPLPEDERQKVRDRVSK